MKYIVAPGREVSINGRVFLGGEVIPEINRLAIVELIDKGIVLTDKPEPKRNEKKDADE